MSVPKKKKSHSKARMERAHQALEPIALSKGPDGQARRPHTLDMKTGMYGDRRIFTPAQLADE